MEWPSNCYLKRICIIRGGVESSLKLMPVTLVPTEILNTSPRVLTLARMRSMAMPPCQSQ